MWMLLPNSPGLFWWDAMIRWLAVAFFIQIPIDIAYNMQQRLSHWYYIIIQVSSMQASRSLPYVRRACGMSHFHTETSHVLCHSTHSPQTLAWRLTP